MTAFGNTKAPWITLGINIGGLLAIMAWAAFWSTAMFGSLFYFGFLRIDRETEFKGNDIVKHGESAYPRDAWVEMQYSMKNQKQFAEGNDLNYLLYDIEVFYYLCIYFLIRFSFYNYFYFFHFP